jgi:hypothetical protein
MKAYQLIRGENLFTILLIPSIWDLDPFFRKRRVRHLIDIDRRGKFSFWSKERLKIMLEVNDRMIVKNPYIIHPTFSSTFPKYTGELLPAYLEMKKKKMTLVRSQLIDDLSSDVVDDDKNFSDEIKHFLSELRT